VFGPVFTGVVVILCLCVIKNLVHPKKIKFNAIKNCVNLVIDDLKYHLLLMMGLD
jgi:hypothetical protein